MISLFWLVMLPVFVAVVTYLFFPKYAKFVVLIFQFCFFILSFYMFCRVKETGIIMEVLGRYDRGIGIAMKLDQVAAPFVLLNAFIFTCALFYNYHKPYMDKLFYFLFLILQGLINGVFMSADLFNIYVLIEVSTILVSVLIMFKKDSQSIYDGMVYLLTNMVSMTFFLLGIGYMYKIFGTLDIGLITERMNLIEDYRSLILPYCLVMTGAGLKAAITPLFSWLPRAHGTASAPSIVSAILSGLYVKGGVYLFIRISDMFSTKLDTSFLFLLLGFITAVVGFIFAISQTDIKLILAYSTVSQIGFIIFGLTLNNDNAYWGSVYHIVNHAIFKSSLFLTAGIIIEEYGTRDIREIHGVFKRLPFVSLITLAAILSITGAPFFNGSISKYLIQKGADASDYLGYGIIFINMGTIMYFIKYSHMFFGKTDAEPGHIRLNQRIVIGLLGVACFLGGVLSPVFIKFLFGQEFHISSKRYYFDKTAIYGLNVVIGYIFYRFFYQKIPLFKKIREIELSFNDIVLSIVIFFGSLLGIMTLGWY